MGSPGWYMNSTRPKRFLPIKTRYWLSMSQKIWVKQAMLKKPVSQPRCLKTSPRAIPMRARLQKPPVEALVDAVAGDVDIGVGDGPKGEEGACESEGVQFFKGVLHEVDS